MMADVDDVLAALDGILDPCSIGSAAPLTMREMGLVQGVAISESGAVAIALRMSSPGCLMGGWYFEPRIQEVVGKLPGVTGVSLTFGDPTTWSENDITDEGKRKIALARQRRMAARHKAPALGAEGA